jgi:hypothetical protein
MQRKFIIGKSLDKALIKYPMEFHNPIELHNPLNLNSAIIERKIIIAVLADKLTQMPIRESMPIKELMSIRESIPIRELTTTETKNLKWVKRVYPNLLQYRNFSIAIQLTAIEKSNLIERMTKYKESRNPKPIKLSNIYRVFTFNM